MKKILILTVLLTGCMPFHKQPVLEFQYTLKPLDLSEHKNITIAISNDKVCLPYDDYTSQLLMLKKLSDYINYQRTIITEMDSYYKSMNK